MTEVNDNDQIIPDETESRADQPLGVGIDEIESRADRLEGAGVKREDNNLMKTFLEHGVQYGRAKRFTDSRLRDYFLRSNKTIEVFDLDQTIQKLEAISLILKELLETEKTILFVGTQPAAQHITEQLATALKQPFLVEKWVGGLMTNFQTIRLRLKYYRELLDKKNSGELEQYPVRERLRMKRELEKMDSIYRGIVNLDRLPEAIFVINADHKPHRTMIREAKIRKIPVYGLCGSDNNPEDFTEFIPGNDKAPKSINFVLGYLGKQLGVSLASNEVEVTNSQTTNNSSELISTNQSIDGQPDLGENQNA